MKKSPASFAIKICCQLVLWEKKKKELQQRDYQNVF